jgi:uncharacterized membrane protein
VKSCAFEIRPENKDMQSRTLELLAAGIVVLAWILAVQAIPTLPQRIPTHFGLSGAPDGYGRASSLWFLPAFATGMYLLLTAVRFVPNRLRNYPVAITERNRERVYALGREMLPGIKVCAMLTVLAVEWEIVDAATRGSLSPYFFAAIFAPALLLIVFVLYYVKRMRAV